MPLDRLHRLGNQFLDIDPIPGLLKRLQIRALGCLNIPATKLSMPENLHTYFELSAQAWTLYKAP
jgi:hypothetical protein